MTTEYREMDSGRFRRPDVATPRTIRRPSTITRTLAAIWFLHLAADIGSFGTSMQLSTLNHWVAYETLRLPLMVVSAAFVIAGWRRGV